MIKLFIADDHKIIRDGIRALLKDMVDIEIVGEAQDGLEAIKILETLSVDVVLMDISMPGINGIDCTRKIKATWPELKVLVLSMSKEDEHIKKMLEAGALGYILKNTGKEELISAIKMVSEGKFYFSNEITDSMMKDYIFQNNEKSNHQKVVELTEREKQVLILISKEFTNAEIALELFISIRTVDAHRRNLLEKTGCRNTAGLMKYAMENHFI
jgi:DNA-binding NarL/FixJ family response regulator